MSWLLALVRHPIVREIALAVLAVIGGVLIDKKNKQKEEKQRSE